MNCQKGTSSLIILIFLLLLSIIGALIYKQISTDAVRKLPTNEINNNEDVPQDTLSNLFFADNQEVYDATVPGTSGYEWGENFYAKYIKTDNQTYDLPRYVYEISTNFTEEPIIDNSYFILHQKDIVKEMKIEKFSDSILMKDSAVYAVSLITNRGTLTEFFYATNPSGKNYKEVYYLCALFDCANRSKIYDRNRNLLWEFRKGKEEVFLKILDENNGRTVFYKITSTEAIPQEFIPSVFMN